MKKLNVDLRAIDKLRSNYANGILIYRQRYTAEQALDMARRATKVGEVSTDLPTLEDFIQANVDPSSVGWQLRNLADGQIVGVILPVEVD